MTQIKLYLDHDVSKKDLVKALRDSGLDIVTTHDVGNEFNTDPEQLAWATQNNRVIYTGNTGEFCEIHKNWMMRGEQHSGMIIIMRRRYTIGQQLQGVQKLAQQLTAQEMVNCCEFLSAWPPS
ncbi:MAG: DUF5615 family PIN-like protein [Thermosynechococcaceae cyanobacterium]